MRFRFGFTKSTVGIESSHWLLGAAPRLHSERPGAKLISACVLSLISCGWLFATPWTVARQAPLSMGFSRQEYWSELLCPPPGDLLEPGIWPVPPALQADSLPTEPPGKPSWSIVNWKLSHKGFAAAAAAKSLQSCPTLCDPIDGSPPGSSVPGILQARSWNGLPVPSPMHESEKWKWSCSVVSDSAWPPWTAAHQAPPSIGLSRQEYWRGVPLPSPSSLSSML